MVKVPTAGPPGFPGTASPGLAQKTSRLGIYVDTQELGQRELGLLTEDTQDPLNCAVGILARTW